MVAGALESSFFPCKLQNFELSLDGSTYQAILSVPDPQLIPGDGADILEGYVIDAL